MIYVNVIGRLGADAELKTSKNGNQFTSMRVASNDFFNGETTTTWVNVTWTGERAIKMQEHMKKGSQVVIFGTLRTSLYSTKNGEQAISTDIFADRVEFVGGKSDASQANGETAATTGTFKPTQKTQNDEREMAVAAASTNAEDDLPF